MSYLGLDPIDPFSIMVSLLVASRWTIAASVGSMWVCLEGGVYVAVRFYVWPSLQKLNRAHPYHHTSDPLKTVLRIFDHIDMLGDYGFEKFITGFFRNCKMEDLRQDNLNSFLAWVMYSEYYLDLTHEQRKQISFVKAEAGRRYGCYFEKGYNPNVKHVSMTLEPIPFVHRPLFIYVANGLLEMSFQATYFRFFGFRQLECGPITYWFREGSAANEEPPLLVLHGITNGWVTYCGLIHSLLQMGTNASNNTRRAMFLVDVNAIKIKALCFDMPNPDDFPRNVKAMLDSHGVQKVSVVGHSFGSITAGSFIQCPCMPYLGTYCVMLD
jgi:hypothetical protein